MYEELCIIPGQLEALCKYLPVCCRLLWVEESGKGDFWRVDEGKSARAESEDSFRTPNLRRQEEGRKMKDLGTKEVTVHQRKQGWSLMIGPLGAVEDTIFLVSGQFRAVSNVLPLRLFSEAH